MVEVYIARVNITDFPDALSHVLEGKGDIGVSTTFCVISKKAMRKYSNDFPDGGLVEVKPIKPPLKVEYKRGSIEKYMDKINGVLDPFIQADVQIKERLERIRGLVSEVAVDPAEYRGILEKVGNLTENLPEGFKLDSGDIDILLKIPKDAYVMERDLRYGLFDEMEKNGLIARHKIRTGDVKINYWFIERLVPEEYMEKIRGILKNEKIEEDE